MPPFHLHISLCTPVLPTRKTEAKSHRYRRGAGVLSRSPFYPGLPSADQESGHCLLGLYLSDERTFRRVVRDCHRRRRTSIGDPGEEGCVGEGEVA